ncbi:MAG: hypothetical protein II025_01415 [Ruminococcus sp.]|nr:hypothetical protein [Ruminococcus sp.]
MKYPINRARIAILFFVLLALLIPSQAASTTYYTNFKNGKTIVFPDSCLSDMVNTGVTVKFTAIDGTVYSYPLSTISSITQEPIRPRPKLTSFKFAKSLNYQVFSDITASISENDITAQVAGIGKRLTATFELSDNEARLYCGNNELHSMVSRMRYDTTRILTAGYPGDLILSQDELGECSMQPYGKQYSVNIVFLTDQATEAPRIDINTVGAVDISSKDYYLDAQIIIDGKGVFPSMTDSVKVKGRGFPGFKKCIPMVFSGIYPADGAKYQDLKDAILKLQLNDASLTFEPETSAALGFGFRCGFLGLLHMDIIQERLEREFNLDIVTTAPSVIYKVLLKTGEEITIDNPLNYPAADKIEAAYEPMVKATLLTPKDYIGAVNTLCQERRGEFVTMNYLDTERVEIHYRLPLNEIIYDFFDSLKSRSRGYASLDYELDGYDESKLVKLDIMLNGEIIDALTFIIHADKAYGRARKMVERLKENIPRQLFEIPVQAAIGGKIIARETVKAMRKDVLAKCYGGDITRKKKLLEKQKEGKKRMRTFGSVEVPSEAFMAVLKLDE